MHIEPDKQRKFDRIPLDRQVKIEFINDCYYTKVKDLSVSGMFIVGDFQGHKEKHCLINLYQTTESTDLSMRVAAEVVRRSDKGIGIKFISMGFDSYKFLESALPQPEDYPFKITDGFSLSPAEKSCTEH